MIKVFLETKEENLIEITLDEFIRKSKSFANGKINKSEAIKILKDAFNNTYKHLEDKNKIYTIVMETEPPLGKINYKTDYASIDLMQQFIIFYAEKLNDVLCQKVLNPKYVRATGNPAYSDINLYGFKKGNDSIIIKSFIFATTPEENELYISTTCGTGGTYILFEKLKEIIADKNFYEKEYNKIEYIHIDSIEKENTINFYGKLQFRKKDKDTKDILKDMIKKIYRKDMLYGEYIRQSELDIGGSMYWAPTEKLYKKLKASYEYTPELWYKNIYKMKKDGISQKDVLMEFLSKYEELKGAGIPDEQVEKKRVDKKEGYDLHAVVIHKPIDLDKAFEESKKFIDEERNFYRETNKSYRFRNRPKQQFLKKSFRSKKINPHITLIYGRLK